VILLKTASEYPIDVSMGLLPFEEAVIKRSTGK